MQPSTVNRLTKSKKTPIRELSIGFESAGMLLTPEEYDAIEDWDENYRYEIINGVLVVSPRPLRQERGPNELLGNLLYIFQSTHPNGKLLDDTLYEEVVRVKNGRRITDRALWIGLGRTPDPDKDIPTVTVEFVSEGKRNQERDYIQKKKEYRETGVQEYWIIDRFDRTMTVFDFSGKRAKMIVVTEDETYESPLLPGFELPLKRIFEAADRYESN